MFTQVSSPVRGGVISVASEPSGSSENVCLSFTNSEIDTPAQRYADDSCATPASQEVLQTKYGPLTPQSESSKQLNKNDWNNKQKNKNKAKARKAKSQSIILDRKKETEAKFIMHAQGLAIPTVSDLKWFLPPSLNIDTTQILSELENVTALFFALKECSSNTQAASILFLFLKAHCSGSALTQLIEYLKVECDMDVLHPQGSDAPDWLDLIKNCKTNWKSITQNAAFKKISTLISMSAALGFCELAKFNVDVHGIRIFSIPAYKQHLVASDLMTAVVDTFTYFVEGGYKCFELKSLSPFIFSDDVAERLETTYFKIVDLAPFMKSGNLLTKKNMSENDFEFLLEGAITEFDTLYKTSEGTWEKKTLFERLIQLRKIRADFIAVRVTGKLREAPFAVYIEGASGVGKSSVAAILMRITLISNGFDASDERITTINECDKYMSNYRSHNNGIFIDDLGNTQAAFVEKSPASKVIEIVNNIPAYANMAEADLKGKVSIEPKCVVATSNLPISVIAGQYSCEPYSICRRFPFQVLVAVKEEFAMEDGRLDSDKVHEAYPDGIPAVPDLWDLTLREPFHDPNNGNLRIVKQKSNIEDTITRLIKQSKKHFSNQSDVVDFASNLDTKLDFCKDCNLPRAMCKCKLDEQMLEIPTAYVKDLFTQLQEYDSKYLVWTNYIPDACFDNSYLDKTFAYLKRKQIFNETRVTAQVWKGSFLVALMSIFWSFFLSFFIIGTTTFVYGRKLVLKKNELIRELRDTNGTMPRLFKKIRDNHVAHIAVAGTLMGVAYLMVKAYKAARVLTDQGTLNPLSMSDIDDRDAQVNPWAGVHVSKIPVHDGATRCTTEELKNNVFKNLFYIELAETTSTKTCNAFFYKSNIALIPAHIWTEDDVICKFYRRGDETNGAYFKSYLSKSSAVKMPNTDLYMVWVPNACSMKDLSPYIAIGEQHAIPATLVYKHADGVRQDFKTKVFPGTVKTTVATFQGFNYELDAPTFNGMCMATLVSESVNKQIIGFHLGGKGTRGGATRITISQLDSAEMQLRKKEGVLLAKSTGTLQTQTYDINIIQNDTVHYKSPTRYLNKGNTLKIYGSVIGQSKMQSTVIPTKISPIVAAVTGVGNVYGPPQFGPETWAPWQASLQFSSDPSIGVEGSILRLAVIDFKVPLLKMLRDMPGIRAQVVPLTEMQTVCGIDSRRFIDKMKPNTSVGYPLSGPKSNHLTLMDPDDFPEFNCPAETSEIFWVEVRRMCAEYRAGRRAYPIFKAALKDEPTPTDKKKVRVFQAAPMAFQLLMRMYFLPLARVLSICPLVSECAVGVNAQGPEWDELSNHIKQFGAERIIAGDYSKYDLRMAAQLTGAAFRILIDLAKASGNYSQDDLCIMEGIATDAIQPLMAYNGDLIEHTGTNPSGQNLTVYVNSIVNALLLRCAYYSIYQDRASIPPFKEVCAIMTYGDDAKGSVKEGYDEFNHISVAKYLGDRDMKFTMPDKTSTPTKYMTDSDADFLKRKNIKNQETGLLFGALCEESIFKSLHSVCKSKAVSNEEQCMSNIDGALREWFAHGETKYEFRRAQMIEIAQKAGITHGCAELQTTYAECVTRFCDKYDVPLIED